ncbi:hypothetical protein GDO86_019809, partial [Hymenochirus boettgeri]
TCYPRDCHDVYEDGLTTDGVYLIYPSGPYSSPVSVYCDMSTKGGPWTVFQKRFNGSVDFYRGWQEYQSGFGEVDGEYWLGLRNVYLLTLTGQYRLRIDLEDFENHKRFVTYEEFSLSRFAVSPEKDGYKLNIDGFKEGDASTKIGDSMESHAGMAFTTFDRDMDLDHTRNCAQIYRGAFWHKFCHSANLNGKYLKGTTTEYATGIVWKTWKGFYYSLKRSEMKMARQTSPPLTE